MISKSYSPGDTVELTNAGEVIDICSVVEDSGTEITLLSKKLLPGAETTLGRVEGIQGWKVLFPDPVTTGAQCFSQRAPSYDIQKHYPGQLSLNIPASC